ncbi:phosphotransferase family protein [Calidifontibacter terrae]
MSSDLPFELTVVAGWLREAGEAVQEPLAAHRIGAGQSNLTYLITDGQERRWVLRRPPLGKLLQSAHDVAREARIMSALADTDVPVPHVFGLWHLEEVPHLLMSYVDGLVIDNPQTGAAVADAVRAGIGPSIARTLGRIHAVDLDAVGLADLASHAPYAERQLGRWSKQLAASRIGETPDLDRLAEVLTANIPAHTEISLVHGDLHLANAMCDPATGEVVAALDWELSTLGDPLADLGTLLGYWPQQGESINGDLFGAAALPGFATRADLVEAYATQTGRDVSDVGFWHVLGLWKLLIIIEGIRRRVLNDPNNAALSGTPGQDYTEHLIARAWDLVDHYGLRS